MTKTLGNFNMAKASDLFNVLPRYANYNFPDRWGSNLIKSGNFGIGVSLYRPRPNIPYDSGRKFCIVVVASDFVRGLNHSPDISRMKKIFSTSNPLKITNSVVRAVTVLMVYLRFVFGVWNKCGSHQRMNINLFMSSIFPKGNTRIPSLFFYVWVKDRFLDGLHFPAGVVSGSAHALYLSVIADHVKPFKADNIFPLFSHCDTFPYNEKPPRSWMESVTKPIQSAGAFNKYISDWFGDKVIIPQVVRR